MLAGRGVALEAAPAFMAPKLRDDLDPRVKEGLVRRRLILMGRRCPCGYRLPSAMRTPLGTT